MMYCSVGNSTTVAISIETKDIINEIRRVFPQDVPSQKDATDYMLQFVNENKEQFIEWVINKQSGNEKI